MSLPDEMLAQRVVERWRGRAMARAPVSLVDIQSLRDRVRGAIPAALLLTLDGSDGSADPDFDLEWIRFWPAADWQYVCEAGLASAEWEGYDEYVLFADYLLWSHGYAFSSCSGAVAIVGAARPIVVAASAAEFLSKYLSNTKDIF